MEESATRAPALTDDIRVVTLLVRLRNVGSGQYLDYPTGCAHIVCADETVFRPGPYRREPALREVCLEPGEEIEGWLTFELPSTKPVASVQFALDVGVASERATWDLDDSVAGR